MSTPDGFAQSFHGSMPRVARACCAALTVAALIGGCGADADPEAETRSETRTDPATLRTSFAALDPLAILHRISAETDLDRTAPVEDINTALGLPDEDGVKLLEITHEPAFTVCVSDPDRSLTIEADGADWLLHSGAAGTCASAGDSAATVRVIEDLTESAATTSDTGPEAEALLAFAETYAERFRRGGYERLVGMDVYRAGLMLETTPPAKRHPVEQALNARDVTVHHRDIVISVATPAGNRTSFCLRGEHPQAGDPQYYSSDKGPIGHDRTGPCAGLSEDDFEKVTLPVADR